jgi:hypothetical protein
MKYFFTICLILVFMTQSNVGSAQSHHGTISGKITDADTGEPIIFGPVALFKNNNRAALVQTDIDGNYSIGNLDPGDFIVEASYIGYQTQLVEGVRIFAGKVASLNIKLKTHSVMEGGIEIIPYQVPVIEQDNTVQGRTYADCLSKGFLPPKDINIIQGIGQLNITVPGSRVLEDLLMAQMLLLQHKQLIYSDVKFLIMVRTSFEQALHLRRR